MAQSPMVLQADAKHLNPPIIGLHAHLLYTAVNSQKNY